MNEATVLGFVILAGSVSAFAGQFDPLIGQWELYTPPNCAPCVMTISHVDDMGVTTATFEGSTSVNMRAYR